MPLAVETKDSDGNPANAGSVTLTIGLPDGTTVTPAVSNPSPGSYRVDYQTVQVGRHTVRWLATGVNSSAYADSFDVLPGDPGYIVSLSRAKRKLRIPFDDHEHDEDLRDYIQAATNVIEDYTKWTIPRRSFTETVDLCGSVSRTLVLGRAPVISVTSVDSVDGSVSWDVSGLDVNTASGVVTVLSGSLFRGLLRAVFVAGMSVIQAKYTRAALIIIEHLWQTERAQSQAGPFPGAYDDTAEGMRFMRGAGYAIPNRALELLGKPGPMVW